MAKRFGILAVLFIANLAYADSPARKSYSDVNFDTKRSSSLPTPGSNPNVASFGISSGQVSLMQIYVSSPGINSKLFVNDNWLAGFSSNPMTPGDLTTTQTNLIYNVQTTTGLVVTSTCSACLVPWTAPDLRVTYERIR